MNRRITNALLAACLISGICTYLLGRRVRLAAAAGNQSMLRYVSAARPLSVGEVLKVQDLAWTRWPIEDPLSGASTDAKALAGRVVLYPMDAGEPVLARDLADAGTGGGLASRIPKGMRALALSSNDVVGVAGFLAPGSRVDVLVTYRTENTQGPVTATVLQNAEVLTAGQRMEPDPTGKPASATVVTLLLNPMEAERAVLASTQGTIQFVLRNGVDKDETHDAPISLARLGGGAEAAFASPGAAVDPGSDPALGAGSGPVASGSARAGSTRRSARHAGMETILGGDSAGKGGQP